MRRAVRTIRSMQLPQDYRATTLGDLLGPLLRAEASGELEVAENSGRTHRILLHRGAVAGVQADVATPSLAEVFAQQSTLPADVLKRSVLRALASGRLHGEVLVRDFGVPEQLVESALIAQAQAVLAAIERVPAGRVRFRAVGSSGRVRPLPRLLAPSEFLRGRVRARDGRAAPARSGAARTIWPEAALGDSDAVVQARRHLGVGSGATRSEIRAAYAASVRALHPDLRPACADESGATAALTALHSAYRLLVC
jgi:hypothetical protein